MARIEYFKVCTQCGKDMEYCRSVYVFEECVGSAVDVRVIMEYADMGDMATWPRLMPYEQERFAD